MNKLFIFTLRLALLVAFAAFLADHPGTALITWHDYIIETSASALFIVTLGFGIVLYLAFRLGHLIKYGPGLWRLHRRLRKLHEGQRHLDQGMVAIASSNAVEAGRLAINARKNLGTTTSTQILQAQAAQLAGDYSSAREIFYALSLNPESVAMGYRGLIMDARRREDWDEVENLIQRLHLAKPETPWLNIIRFDQFVRRQDWQQANTALAKIASNRLLKQKDINKSRAAILVTLSQNEATAGRPNQALQLAEQAIEQNKDWLPAVINLAQRQLDSGNKRTAYRTIVKYWSHMPHPHLAYLYHQGEVDALNAYKQIQKFCNEKDHVSQLALAEAALAANIWGEARRHLMEIISKNLATQSAYRLLARLERRESGNEVAAQHWLNKAFDAAPDPVWLCRLCGASHTHWQAACAHCGQFNTLDWRTPGQGNRPNTHLNSSNTLLD